MSDNWRESVNQNIGLQRINDINKYIDYSDVTDMSPIDRYYHVIEDILKIAVPDFLSNHPSMGALFLIGIVSATENYIRDLFGQILHICPISKSKSSSQNVSLGSVLWHGNCYIERGAFEHISFANPDTIINKCNNYIGYKFDKGDPFKEYATVCQFRHSIVHSDSIIAGKNAIALKISNSDNIIKVKIDYSELQECAAICTSLVTTINSKLFQEIAKRWGVDWPKEPFWDSTKEHSMFKLIWECFYSTNDHARNSIDSDLSLMKCKNLIKNQLR